LLTQSPRPPNMTSNCPQCGAHLGENVTPTPAVDSDHPSDADQRSPDLDAGRDHLDSVKDDLIVGSNKGDLGASQDDLRRLKRLICPCPCFNSGAGGSAQQLTLRPYLCVNAVGVVKPGRPRETLDRTAIKMQAAIRRAGEGSVDTILTSRHLARRDRYWQRPARMWRVFQAIGAIIYDMEWTSDEGQPDLFNNAEGLADATNTIGPSFDLRPGSFGCAPVIELMLLRDYGLPADPLFEYDGWLFLALDLSHG